LSCAARRPAAHPDKVLLVQLFDDWVAFSVVAPSETFSVVKVRAARPPQALAPNPADETLGGGINGHEAPMSFSSRLLAALRLVPRGDDAPLALDRDYLGRLPGKEGAPAPWAPAPGGAPAPRSSVRGKEDTSVQAVAALARSLQRPTLVGRYEVTYAGTCPGR
jgi:hypothetical protein